MRRSIVSLVALTMILLFATLMPAAAQDIPFNTVIDPGAVITLPPPIYTLYGTVTIRGSANVANMTGYFIEYRELNPDFTPNTAGSFTPVVPRQAVAVLDNILGIWDTTQVDDGAYELRLTVTLSGGSSVSYSVAPLRVENTPPLFPITENDPRFGLPLPPIVTDEPGAPAATIAPAPTQATSAPTLTPTVSSINVRTGDSTLYPVVTTLLQGQQAEIIGISNTGSNWYQIRTPNGRVGFVSNTVVQVSGDTSGLPRVQPPPVPFTPTPVPTNTPTAAVNLVAGIVVLNPPNPTCGQPFTVGFDVANLGTLASTGGVISVTDSRAADGSVQTTSTVGFPPLGVGVTTRVNIPLTISTWYNEVHRITLIIDPGNAIPETNEQDNQRVIEYTLAQGGCS